MLFVFFVMAEPTKACGASSLPFAALAGGFQLLITQGETYFRINEGTSLGNFSSKHPSMPSDRFP